MRFENAFMSNKLIEVSWFFRQGTQKISNLLLFVKTQILLIMNSLSSHSTL